MTLNFQRRTKPDDVELDSAVVAAIVAILTTLDQREASSTSSNWWASGKVVPDWRDTDDGTWRARDRRQGWRE